MLPKQTNLFPSQDSITHSMYESPARRSFMWYLQLSQNVKGKISAPKKYLISHVHDTRNFHYLRIVLLYWYNRSIFMYIENFFPLLRSWLCHLHTCFFLSLYNVPIFTSLANFSFSCINDSYVFEFCIKISLSFCSCIILFIFGIYLTNLN